MTTPTLFKEYVWLVNTINQARNITLNDINKKWLKTEMSGGVEMARITFNRHKAAIEDIFGIRIECDRSKLFIRIVIRVFIPRLGILCSRAGNVSFPRWE